MLSVLLFGLTTVALSVCCTSLPRLGCHLFVFNWPRSCVFNSIEYFAGEMLLRVSSTSTGFGLLNNTCQASFIPLRIGLTGQVHCRFRRQGLKMSRNWETIWELGKREGAELSSFPKNGLRSIFVPCLGGKGKKMGKQAQFWQALVEKLLIGIWQLLAEKTSATMPCAHL